MITGEDIENEAEKLTQEEVAEITKRVHGPTKKAMFDILDQYSKDSRKVTSEAMVYAATTAIEVGVTGLLLMCNGQRKAVDNLLSQMLDHLVERVKEDQENEDEE